MYATRHFDSPTKPATMDTMFPVKQTMAAESNDISTNMGMPKKDSLVQTVLGAITNIIGEQWTRFPGTFLSTINNPLSVTLVPSEGSIQQEILKSLTRGSDPEFSKLYFEKNLFSRENERSQNFKDYFYTNEENTAKGQNKMPPTAPTAATSGSKIIENPIFGKETVLEDNNSERNLKPNVISCILQKVMSNISDRLQPSSSETSLPEKPTRTYSPKPSHRKSNMVARVRGRGRGKSQLRRSGVSQTRHRKERGKYNLSADIRDDFETWQDLDFHEDDSDLENEEEEEEDPASNFCIIDEVEHHESFTFADIKPRKRKQKRKGRKKDLRASEFNRISTRVRYIPEIDTGKVSEECDFENRDFRSRLLSESSIDSEDSYCIVFEHDYESNSYSESTDDCTDNDDSDNDDAFRKNSGSEDDNSDSEDEFPRQKVKFNLKPIVHFMVQWDYAYRAARRGPWEQMARDRDRFKGRIMCLKSILDPILTVQHRNHIYEERFAVEEEQI